MLHLGDTPADLPAGLLRSQTGTSNTRMIFNTPSKNGQHVMYITERCVFVLKEDGLHLTEIAPGIDLQTQILDQMEFEPIIDRNADGSITLMDAKLFADGLMGLKEMKEGK